MIAHTSDPKVEAWIERAKSADLLEVAQKAGAVLKKSGAENTGACPFCGGTDRFSVNTAKRTWNCRGGMDEGTNGRNAVDLYMHAQQCGFIDAITEITGEPKPDGIHEESAEERRAREARTAKRRAEIAAQEERDAKEAEARRRRDEEAFLAVLKRAVPIEGTHAAAYLAARGLSPPKGLTRDLRFVRDLDYFGHPAGEDRAIHLATLPAMVAVIRDVNGAIIGISQTYLDQNEPKKWVFGPEKGIAPKKRKNPPVKVRGEVKGGMVRLGMVGERLAIAEGVITALSWHQLGFGPEDVTIAAAVSLGNMVGAWTGTQNHPTRTTADGKATKVPNGIPDMARPGVILPAGVREVILIGDSDSEAIATRMAVLTGARRFQSQGLVVGIQFAPDGQDFNDMLIAEASEKVAA